MQRQPRSCNNIPRFFNKPHLLHVRFVKVVPGTIFTCWSNHHFVVIGKAEQWHQATIKIPRRANFIYACSRHTGVVHHAHPVRGESHIQYNAN